MICFVDEERCLGCGLCVRVCPLDVFRMIERDGRRKPVARAIYPEDCMSCFICEEYCPADCLYVSPERSPLHAIWPFPEETERRDGDERDR
ncbi:4Fe-4S dicluster domain-containing protein [Thermoflexus hugenholtzii]